MKYKGYLYILIGATLWALIGPMSKFALASGTGPLEIGFFRAFFAWFFFASHAIYRGKTTVAKKDLPLLAFFGIIGIAVFYAANFIAVKEGGAAFAAVLLYTAPAWVAMLSPVIFKEILTIRKIAAVILTMGGVAGICFFGKNGGGASVNFSTIAVVTGIVSGLSYSMYYIFGKYFSSRYEASTLFMYILPVGAAAMLPFISFFNKPPEAWAVLIFLAVFCTYIANSFYYAGLKRLEPTRAVLTATVEPVFAAFFAWVIWGELFTLSGMAGAALIITGVILTIYDK